MKDNKNNVSFQNEELQKKIKELIQKYKKLTENYQFLTLTFL